MKMAWAQILIHKNKRNAAPILRNVVTWNNHKRSFERSDRLFWILYDNIKMVSIFLLKIPNLYMYQPCSLVSNIILHHWPPKNMWKQHVIKLFSYYTKTVLRLLLHVHCFAGWGNPRTTACQLHMVHNEHFLNRRKHMFINVWRW